MTSTENRITAESIVVSAMGALRASRDTSFYRLKRGTALLDAMLEPVFHSTLQSLRENRIFVNQELLAAAILLLARLHDHSGTTRVASALARENFTQLRFQTLLRSHDAAELFTNLQRATRFCDNCVCPFDLTRIVLGWSESQIARTRTRMTSDFYAFGPAAAA